jgi:hypothetical protein
MGVAAQFRDAESRWSGPRPHRARLPAALRGPVRRTTREFYGFHRRPGEAMVNGDAKMEKSVTSTEVSNRGLDEDAGFGALDSSLDEGAVLWTSRR